MTIKVNNIIMDIYYDKTVLLKNLSKKLVVEVSGF